MPSAPWELSHLTLRPRLVWSMALSSLRLRLGQTLLTLLTIATCTAFLIYLLTMPGAADDPSEKDSRSLMLILALLVSGAGVLNTMLMSVTRRYREIGTMKCLGALDSFVLWSVLLEAAALGLCGAAVGVIAGLAITLGLALIEHGRSALDFLQLGHLPLKLLFAFAIGLSLTTLGALVPAWIASRMPPMEAMRGEK